MQEAQQANGAKASPTRPVFAIRPFPWPKSLAKHLEAVDSEPQKWVNRATACAALWVKLRPAYVWAFSKVAPRVYAWS